MGGEKSAVLMYGPRVQKTMNEWIDLFGLVNKEQWVKEFLEGKPYEPYEVDEIFGDNFSTPVHDLLWDFLEKQSMIYAYDNNVDWGCALIGREVTDYDTIGEDAQQSVKEFCWAYGLPPPTFYAAMVGEYS